MSDLALETASEPSAGPGADWGAVRVLSGATGAVLRSFQGAGGGAHLHESIGTAGDLDGDGKDEIWWSFAPHKLCVGTVGQEQPIFELEVERCSACVPLEDDVDHDDFQDFVVTRFPNLFSAQRQAISLVSGRTGMAIWTIEGARVSDVIRDRFGEQARRVGDLDADGIHDLAVLDVSGQVKLVSCKEGILLRTLPSELDFISGAMDGLGDLDGDGFCELLTYSGFGRLDAMDPEPAKHLLQVVSSQDGRALQSFVGDGLLWSVCSPGDVDGDGQLDIAWNHNGANVASGTDLRLLHHFEGFVLPGRADWNSDGYADLLLVQNVFFEASEEGSNDGWRKGRVEVRSGKDGSILQTFDESVLPPLE